jgi:hypothetical protein
MLGRELPTMLGAPRDKEVTTSSSGPYVFGHWPIYPKVLILKFNLEDCYVRVWEMIEEGLCLDLDKLLAIFEGISNNGGTLPLHLMLNLFTCSVVCVNMLASFSEGFHTSLVCWIPLLRRG